MPLMGGFDRLHNSLSGIESPQHHVKTVNASELTAGTLPIAQLPNVLVVLEGDNIFASSLAEVSTNSIGFVLVKTMRLPSNMKGTIRIRIETKNPDGPVYRAYGRVYRNGSYYQGLESDTDSTTYVEHLWDSDGWEPNDLIQIYLKTTHVDHPAYLKNFTLAVDLALIPVFYD